MAIVTEKGLEGIKQRLNNLHEKFAGKTKPIDKDLYYLIRDTAYFLTEEFEGEVLRIIQHDREEQGKKVVCGKPEDCIPNERLKHCDRCGRLPSDIFPGGCADILHYVTDWPNKRDIRAVCGYCLQDVLNEKEQIKQMESQRLLDALNAPQPTAWVLCDKGWFGISQEHYRIVQLWIDTYYANLCGTGFLPKRLPLSHLMIKADAKSIPYEITTVKPY